MGMNPFHDDGDDEAGVDDKLEIDHEFQKRYEYNKRREDLQRYEEMKKKGQIPDSDDESESDEDDDEEDLVSGKEDLKFFDALIKVKKQDPILKQKDVKLFDSDDSDSDDKNENEIDDKIEDKNVKKKEKKLYLKDVIAKQLLEDAPKSDEEEENGSEDSGEEEEDGEGEKKVKSLAEEQEEARRAFLEAAEAEIGDEDEDFLKFKGSENRVGEEDEEEDGDDEEEDVMKSKLDEYFGSDDELDDNSKFLKDYFRKKLYLEKDEVRIGEEVEKLSESEEEDESEEEGEGEIKYRFEENAGDRVMGFSRNVEGSVRKKVSKRKEHRLSKEQRRAIEEVERQEEVKHLKNLKRQEYMEKIRKVKEVGGLDEEAAWALHDDLEEEFDPVKHERKMKELYGDEYYGAAETDPNFVADEYEDDEKPDFDEEDELLGLPKGWYKQYKGEEEAGGKKGKKKKKKKNEDEEPVDDAVAKVKEEMQEELYKLDYEDAIGDLKTRFRYTKVKPQSFGLSGRDLILMDEKKLKQYVPVKKLAPYRENEFKLPRGDKYKLLLEKKELYNKLTNGDVSKKDEHLKENDDHSSFKKNKKDEAAAELKLESSAATESKKSKKKRKREEVVKENDNDKSSDKDTQAVKVKVTEPELDTPAGSESKKSKKKRRKAGPNMSESRLMAYGKIPSKSKTKTKG